MHRLSNCGLQETYEWYPLEKCVPLLQKNRYACFSDPSHSIEGEAPSELPNAPEVEPDLKDLEDVQIVVTRSDGRKVAVPVPVSLLLHACAARWC